MDAADKKRWAILPPPSLTADELSGGFNLSEALRKRHGSVQKERLGSKERQGFREQQRPARRAVSGSVFHEPNEPVDSSVHELEPSDSERVTEVPGTDGSAESSHSFVESRLETIPAPPLEDEPS